MKRLAILLAFATFALSAYASHLNTVEVAINPKFTPATTMITEAAFRAFSKAITVCSAQGEWPVPVVQHPYTPVAFSDTVTYKFTCQK